MELVGAMADYEPIITNDAKTIAKNLVESIVTDVMIVIMEQTGSCNGSTEEITLEQSLKNEVLSCVKEGLLEKCTSLTIQEDSFMGNHLNDVSYASHPNVCIQSSTSSPQGEGDFQQKPTQQSTFVCHIGPDTNSFPSINGKSILNSSPTLDAVHDEILHNLDISFHNLSFHDIEVTSDNTKEGEDKPCDALEASQTDLRTTVSKQSIRDNCSDFEYIVNSENHVFELKKSKKFWHYNNTQYIPASTDQLLPNYCEVVVESNENPQFEGKTDQEAPETLSHTSEVDGGKDTNDFPPSNPFRNPFLCSTSQSKMVLSPSSSVLNSTNNSKTEINLADKEEYLELINIDPEETSEDVIRVVEPVDMENDLFETRTYWSNTGLITENKINRKSICYLPDNIGIESIRSATPVNETCLKGHHQGDVQLVSLNNDHNNDANVNYLSFPKKSERKKKKNLVARLTTSLSNIFSFRKSSHVEVKK